MYFKTQHYKGIPLQLINRNYVGDKAKRFTINGTNQNVWIPNKHLDDKGRILEGQDLDYIFRKALNQLNYAGINHAIPGIKRRDVALDRIIQAFRSSFRYLVEDGTIKKELANDMYKAIMEKAKTDKDFRKIVVLEDSDHDDVFDGFHVAFSKKRLAKLEEDCSAGCPNADFIEPIKIGKYKAEVYKAYQTGESINRSKGRVRYHIIFILY